MSLTLVVVMHCIAVLPQGEQTSLSPVPTDLSVYYLPEPNIRSATAVAHDDVHTRISPVFRSGSGAVGSEPSAPMQSTTSKSTTLRVL